MSDDLDAKEFGEHLDMARDHMDELEEWDARKPGVQARVLRAAAKDIYDARVQGTLLSEAGRLEAGGTPYRVEDK